MEMNHLLLSLLFGTIGLGMFMYGKKTLRFVPLGAGLALMVVPYFISSLLALAGICVVLMALPWIIRQD
ncbi:MAG: hypothetical protein ACHRHE_10735 [Tepidisphaerales bacterium]